MIPPSPGLSPAHKAGALGGGLLVTALLFAFPVLTRWGDQVEEIPPEPAPRVLIAPPEPPQETVAEARPDETTPPPQSAPRAPEPPASEMLSLRELEFALSSDLPAGEGFFDQTLGFPVGAFDQSLTFELDEVDEPPVAVRRVPPRYPYRLRRDGLSGEVVLVFRVSAEGQVEEPRVERTTHPDFSSPALEAVRRWQFEAGRKGGQAVAVWVRTTIEFNLQ